MKDPAHFKFRLYVAGDAPNSRPAVNNLEAICREHPPDRHEIEVVSVIREPLRAFDDGVVLTPLLMKLSPPPIRRIFGNLSQLQFTLRALDLAT